MPFSSGSGFREDKPLTQAADVGAPGVPAAGDAEGVAPCWVARRVSSEPRKWLQTLLLSLRLRFQVGEEP